MVSLSVDKVGGLVVADEVITVEAAVPLLVGKVGGSGVADVVVVALMFDSELLMGKVDSFDNKLVASMKF